MRSRENKKFNSASIGERNLIPLRLRDNKKFDLALTRERRLILLMSKE